jgi:hypothetical protein
MWPWTSQYNKALHTRMLELVLRTEQWTVTRTDSGPAIRVRAPIHNPGTQTRGGRSIWAGPMTSARWWSTTGRIAAVCVNMLISYMNSYQAKCPSCPIFEVVTLCLVTRGTRPRYITCVLQWDIHIPLDGHTLVSGNRGFKFGSNMLIIAKSLSLTHIHWHNLSLFHSKCMSIIQFTSILQCIFLERPSFSRNVIRSCRHIA